MTDRLIHFNGECEQSVYSNLIERLSGSQSGMQRLEGDGAQSRSIGSFGHVLRRPSFSCDLKLVIRQLLTRK